MIGYEGQAANRWANLVHRIFGQRELVPPGVVLEMDRPEWRVLKGELLWTTGEVTVAAVAANNGRVQVLNPANSRRISVVTHVLTQTAAASSKILCTVGAAAAGAPAPCLAVDTRLPFNPGPGAPTVMTQSLIANNNALISGYRVAAFNGNTTAFTLFALPVPVILDEGQNFTAFDVVVNDTLIAYIFGYERPATVEELNP